MMFWEWKPATAGSRPPKAGLKHRCRFFLSEVAPGRPVPCRPPGGTPRFPRRPRCRRRLAHSPPPTVPAVPWTLPLSSPPPDPSLVHPPGLGTCSPASCLPLNVTHPATPPPPRCPSFQEPSAPRWGWSQPRPPCFVPTSSGAQESRATVLTATAGWLGAGPGHVLCLVRASKPESRMPLAREQGVRVDLALPPSDPERVDRGLGISGPPSARRG